MTGIGTTALYEVNDALRDVLRRLGVLEPDQPGVEQDAYDALLDGLTHTVANAVTAWLRRDQCPRCGGEGRIAGDERGVPFTNGEPWSAWADLPERSATAVHLGLVKPAFCLDCGGTGRQPSPAG